MTTCSPCSGAQACRMHACSCCDAPPAGRFRLCCELHGCKCGCTLANAASRKEPDSAHICTLSPMHSCLPSPSLLPLPAQACRTSVTVPCTHVACHTRVQGQRAVRGRVPAGHLHRPPPHRQAPDRDRQGGAHTHAPEDSCRRCMHNSIYQRCMHDGICWRCMHSSICRRCMHDRVCHVVSGSAGRVYKLHVVSACVAYHMACVCHMLGEPMYHQVTCVAWHANLGTCC